MEHPNIVCMIEYIQNVFYFAIVPPGKELRNLSFTASHYFSIDKELLYENYYSDFGPLNISCVYKYCCKLNEKFKLHLHKRKVVHYTINDPRKISNSAFLIGSYGVIYLGLTPEEAYQPLTIYGQEYKPFQDASQGESVYTLTVLDCLNALFKAIQHGMFNMHDFDVNEYDRLDKVQGGDLNWIVPGKFLAFIGPVDYTISIFHPPEIYLEYFLEHGVGIVIRLNKKFYDEKVFTSVGIKHYDLFFPDGSCPPKSIVVKFLQIVEDHPNRAIAVHCKAGLGRTGSLIGCYLIKHYRMTAREAIGWMRLCRPGSVIGHQQTWLEQLEPWLMKQGHQFRKYAYNDSDSLPVHQFGIYSVKELKWLRSEKYLDNTTNYKKYSSPMRNNSSSSTGPRRSSLPKNELLNKNYTVESANVTTVKNKTSSQTQYRVDFPSKEKKAETGKASLIYKRRNDSGIEYDEPVRKGSGEPNLKYKNNTEAVPKHHESRDRQKCKVLSASANKVKPKTNNVLRKPTNNSKITNLNSAFTITSDNRQQVVNNIIEPYNKTSPPGSANSNARSRYTRSPSPVYRRKDGPEEVIKSKLEKPTCMKKKTSSSCQTNNLVTIQQDTAKSKKIFVTGTVTHRDRSVGAQSLGTQAIGSKPPSPAFSTKSDDRRYVTQGDLLNSIKFHRQLRSTISRESGTDSKFFKLPPLNTSSKEVNTYLKFDNATSMTSRKSVKFF